MEKKTQKRYSFFLFAILVISLISVIVAQESQPTLTIEEAHYSRVVKLSGIEKYLFENVTHYRDGTSLIIEADVNLNVYHYLRDNYLAWGGMSGAERLQVCNTIREYILDDYPNFDCTNPTHQQLLLDAIQGFVNNGWRILQNGLDRGFVDVSGGHMTVTIPNIQHLDRIRIGDFSLVTEYQTMNLLSYDTGWGEANVSLFVNDSDGWNASSDIWVVNNPENDKFGANVSRTNDSYFKYRVESDREIKQQSDLVYYISRDKQVWCGSVRCSVEERHLFDFSDICTSRYNNTIINQTTNETDGSVLFNPQCSFNQISNEELEIHFWAEYNSTLGFIRVDPTITITDVSSANAILTNITAENNFTHLTISDTTSPINSSNLLIYLPFDTNTSSTKFYDYSANNFDVDFVGNISWNNSGVYGGATISDGDVDYLKLNSYEDVFNFSDGDFTMSTWVYINENVNGQTFLSFQHPTSLGNRVWDLGTTGFPDFRRLFCGIEQNGGTSNSITTGLMTWDVQTWHHFVCTVNSTDVAIFIDGSFSAKTSRTVNATANSNAIRLFVGGRTDQSGFERSLNGSQDETMILNTSLTASQILDLYNNQSSRFFPTGTQEFQDNNVSSDGSETFINITIESTTDFDSMINVTVGNVSGTGYDFGDEFAFTNNFVSDIPIGTPNNISLKFIFYAGNSSSNPFITPNLINNVVIDSFGEAAPTGDTEAPVVNLIAPTNGTTVSNESVSFNATATDNVNVSIMAFYLWNSTNSLINQTNTSTSGTSVSVNLTVVLPYEDTFEWNYLAFDNATTPNSAFNSTNFTLTFSTSQLFSRSASDSFTQLVNVLRLSFSSRSAELVTNLVESANRIIDFFRNPSDTFNLIISSLRKTFAFRSAEDTINSVDAADRTYIQVREPIAIFDLIVEISRGTFSFRQADDTVLSIINIDRVLAKQRQASDTINTVITVVRQTKLFRASEDIFNLIVSSARKFLGFRTAQDTFNLVDSPDRTYIQIRGISDIFLLFDSVDGQSQAGFLVFSRSVSDIFLSVISVERTEFLHRNPITIFDLIVEINRILSGDRSATDLFLLNINVDRTKILTRDNSIIFLLVESAQRVTDLFRSPSDIFNLQIDSARTTTAFRSPISIFNLVDTVTGVKIDGFNIFSRSVSDIFSTEILVQRVSYLSRLIEQIFNFIVTIISPTAPEVEPAVEGASSGGALIDKLLCEETFNYVNLYDEDLTFLPEFIDDVENRTGIRYNFARTTDYIENWQDRCSLAIERTLQERKVCDELFFFILDNPQYSSSQLNEFRENLTFINIEQSLLKKYADNYEDKCVPITDRVLPFKRLVIPVLNFNLGNVPRCSPNLNISILGYSLDYSVPFTEKNLGELTCVEIDRLRWFFKLDKEGEDYVRKGLRTWIVLLPLFVLVAAALLRTYSNRKFLNKMKKEFEK